MGDSTEPTSSSDVRNSVDKSAYTARFADHMTINPSSTIPIPLVTRLLIAMAFIFPMPIAFIAMASGWCCIPMWPPILGASE
jgi:hypothetical protein